MENMADITSPAKIENLISMIKFITEGAEKQGFDDKKIYQVQLASEEVLVNIINYAYPDRNGDIKIKCTTKGEKGIEIKIIDSGIPFDPLSLPKPDINIPIKERNIGGLGIYMMLNIMDKVHYKRDQNQNILTLIKY